MANGLYPVILTEELGQIRINIGDLEAELNEVDPSQSTGFLVGDDVIEFSLSKYTDKDSATRVYLATVDVLRYLVATLARQIRYRERSGNHELEGYFNTQFENYKDLLDKWTKDPSLNPFAASGFLINTTKPIVSMGMFDDIGN